MALVHVALGLAFAGVMIAAAYGYSAAYAGWSAAQTVGVAVGAIGLTGALIYVVARATKRRWA